MADSYHQKVCDQVRSFIGRQQWDYVEKEELNAFRFDIRYGKSSAIFKIYTTGTIQVQGGESNLKETLLKLKKAIQNNEILADEILPFEIEKFPETLQKSIPSIDPVIIRFLSEAILCYKANSLLGCSFLLGAASEKAMWLLINSYVAAIENEKNRQKLESRISNKFISKAYDEFKRSISSSKSNLPNDLSLQDLDTKIESIFQFCRICRNEVGHPQISPNLDRGVLLANMGQFVQYTKAIYNVIDYFENNQIAV